MIQLPTIYTTRMKSKLNALQISGNTVILDWIPHTILSVIFTRYLMTKYGSDCYINPLMRVEHLNDTEATNMSFEIYKCVKHSQDDNPVILGFGISTTGDEVNHQNTLIYRKGTRTLEHFEPHGKLTDWAHSNNLKVFMKKVKNNLQTRLGYDINIEHPDDICPVGLGLQRIEEYHNLQARNGYCIAWNLFFIELILCNPTIPSKQLLMDILHLLNFHTRGRRVVANDLLYIINGYVMLIYEKITKYLRYNGNAMKIDDVVYECRNNPRFKMQLIESMYNDLSEEISFNLKHITPPKYKTKQMVHTKTTRCPIGLRRNKTTRKCEVK
jgi:hypothetical protein